MPTQEASQTRRTIGVGGALAALYRLLSPRRRRHFHFTLLLMVVGAAAELVTLGAVIPFLALVANPAEATRSAPVRAAMVFFGWRDEATAVLGATLLLVAAALSAGALRLLLSWVTQAFVFRFGHELSTRLYGRLLRQPYLWYLQHNSSRGIGAIEKLQQSIISVLLPVMQGLVAAGLALGITLLLVVLDPRVALVAALAVFCLYVGVSLITRKRLHASSQSVNDAHTARIQQVQEGLGGIRDILLDRSQPVFERSFAALDEDLRRGQLVVSFLGNVPRIVIESGAIVLIAVIALYMSRQPGGVVGAIPILGAFALGAQRLLPQIQLIYMAVTRTAASVHSIDEICRLASAPVALDTPEGPPLVLRKQIELRRVSFTYPQASLAAVHDLDLTIAAGERIGLLGATGSGKSTFLDLVMGLLEPSAGSIVVDGITLNEASRPAWQSQIAHVPQFIYLADSSVAANIAFGVPPEKVDMQRVRISAEQAQIAGVIEALANGYETPVGERGVRLSGGERQRLGIARALYKRSAVLVLDEATSALDDETEAAVMAALCREAGERTLLIVAHRLSTLSLCNRLIRLEGGRVIEQGSYDGLVLGQTGPLAL